MSARSNLSTAICRVPSLVCPNTAMSPDRIAWRVASVSVPAAVDDLGWRSRLEIEHDGLLAMQGRDTDVVDVVAPDRLR